LVTTYTVGTAQVLLDASPFYRFCDGGQIITLASYLGKRAWITLEVEEELRRGAVRYTDLRTLQRMNWPHEDHRLELTTALKRELLDVLRAIRKPGEHRMKNAGEVSSVLMAQHLGGVLVVLDDRDGRTLSRRRNVPRLSTAMLVAEMVVVGAMAESTGFAVYDAATPPHVGEREFAGALSRTRAALAR
jgi:predicted nucleic acid-binding protein